ncbi:MAG: hypothetical protein HKO68_04925 [Desulfobacterales bacterium]|nr:pyridoxamine 5'-phosphate oxidase family protein [Deltaproteobacteria bacterium]NNL75662.1 hypothetical protein [Desulfobacterales bacterium]
MARTNDSDHFPTQQELKELAGRLVAGQTTMTLATAKGDEAWAAPVYYVYVKSAFYFLSSPSSRHIKETLHSGQASATLYASASTWTEIRGLQMTGCIRAADGKFEAMQVLREYLKKYPFTKDFFKKNVAPDLKMLSERFGVKLYKFIPTLVYYLDNQIQFAFRAEVQF